MPVVTFDGAAAERTNHLRYLGIHFDRMLTYRQHVEATALQRMKGMSVPKAIVAESSQQWHFSSCWITVWCSCSVIENRLGLIARILQKTLLNLDRVQNEEMRLLPGTNKDTATETMRFMLDLLQMQTRQKMEQAKAHTTGKSPRPTPWSRDRHKRTQTGTGQVSDGSSRRINTASMAAGRIQAKQRAGKECKPFPALLWNNPASKLWANGQHTCISPRQSQFWIFSKRKLIVSELQLLVFLKGQLGVVSKGRY